MMMLSDVTPPLSLVLVHPQIPPNTGNVARLCAVTGSRLILIGPLGFSIASKDLRRAGLDYWDKVFQTFYPSLDDYLADHAGTRKHLFSSHAEKSFWQTSFQPGDHLIFGSEQHGLPQEFTDRYAESLTRIPMLPSRRCLNLSTSVGIAAYEALRQISARELK